MKKFTFCPISPKVNFIEQENRILKHWYSSGLVEKYLKRNKSSPKRFSFIDGPITANNPMGVHHAWGRTFKDLWQRYHTMKGEELRYQNGFDCQGLWVEVEVEKELGIRNKKEIENLIPGDKKASIAKFVELCKERVYKFSKIQTEQSKRLGNFMDWDHSYYTMSDENNYMIWYFLKTCHEKGWIYKGRDSVPWCPRCETAISQHEMLTEDYKEVVHESIYFELPIIGRKREYLLVWTTTPWTIPANIAVAIDEKLDYALVESISGDLFWLAKELVSQVFAKDYKRIVKTVKGRELVGLKYHGPFDHLPEVSKVAKAHKDVFHTVVATDPLILPVTTTEGTGLVHTAVSAGAEDYKLGKKLGLPMIPVIADNAEYLPDLGFLSGKNAKKHPEIILDYLVDENKKGNNWVFKIEKYKHRYPACWRCKTELVWKVADEWYIAMDKLSKTKNTKTFREQMMSVARKIHWMPEFGLERELDWLSNMHDWLISKPNRYWGLALPIYECKKCGKFEVIGSKNELQRRAISGWKEFDGHSPHKPWIDEVKIKCEKCGESVKRLPDVGNVWLDAGIVPYSTLVDPETKKVSYLTDKKYWHKWFPADFITESFPGQFKNWFYSLIALSTALEMTPSFKTVLGFGTLLGEDGRPMHKSWGNAIEFNEGADKIGVDVMRWMYVTHDPTQNMLFGYKKADETRRRFHLLLWNVYNFFITYASVDEWNPSSLEIKSDHILDRWILSQLNQVILEVSHYLDKFDAFKASLELENFVSDLSLWYVRLSRSRVGPSARNTQEKNQCYATYYLVLVKLAQLLAPFTPFMSEVMFRNLTGDESVHLSVFPNVNKDKIDLLLNKNMVLVRQIVEKGHALRKEAKLKVRQPLRILQVHYLNWVGDGKLLELIKLELNVKEIEVIKDEKELSVALDTKLTPELKTEGDTREIIRQIQLQRKEKGCKIDQKIAIILPQNFSSFSDELLSLIKQETLSFKITWGKELSISTD